MADTLPDNLLLRNFKRESRLTVYPMTTPVDDNTFGVAPSSTVGLIITGLRVEFDIVRDLEHHPNRCSIKITNLNEDSRRALARKPLHVIMEAGYEGQLRTIFEGDVTYTTSDLDHPNWVTELHLGDGARASKRARINKSFGKGTTYRTMIGELCKSLGQPFPKNLENRQDARVPSALAVLDDQINHGRVLTGSARDRLTELLNDLDMQWSFQNNKLQILGANESANYEYEISEATGMIGAPEFGTPTKKGKIPNVTIRHILFPEPSPGSRVRVRSRNLNGLCKVIKVTHRGDTHGDPWETVFEVKPL